MGDVKFERRFGCIAAGALLLAFSCADRSAFSTRARTEDEGASGAAGAPGASGADGQGGEAGTGMSGAGNGGGSGDPCDSGKASPAPECPVYVQQGAKGSGTKSSPLGSLEDALAFAVKRGHSQVFVCAGTYEEKLTVEEGSTPLEIVGGFDCETWESVDTMVTKVVAPAGTHALEIVSHQVELRSMRFDVPDATEASASAIGGYVIDSQVRLEDVQVIVGNGAAGANGVLVPYVFPSPANLVGKNATASVAGAETQYTCPNGSTTIGGAGGGKWGSAIVAGSTGLPPNPGDLSAGKGGIATSESTCLATGRGGNGSPGRNGLPASATSAVGRVLLDRWLGGDGRPGLPGVPGQGGGGGGGTGAAHGAGGGAGGCGGAGGPGGKAGGSSIGLVAVRSELTVEASVIKTSDGGAGGAGVMGQAGSSGGPSGAAYSNGSTIIGCLGGIGGPGGQGGSGAGGAGGISVGIVSTSDSSVVLVETDTKQGLPGVRGKGGLTPSLDGVPGIAQATYVP